ncbi:fibroblast growth factor 22 isoform X1 [Athene noctua]|uniref:fibroblast growth factor 22 isoform X1 n=1 Tax=Athene noctua TaxID=126797 RepID=UPI003EBFC1A3
MRRGGPAALAACLAGALAVLAGPAPAAAPGTGGAAWGGRRPPRSYGHLEGDVRWRRLFSATRFFLRIDGGGGVEGTRWRERPGSIVEIRSVRVGVVAIRAVHTGFYLAMNKRGRLYGSVGRTLPPGRYWTGVRGAGQSWNGGSQTRWDWCPGAGSWLPRPDPLPAGDCTCRAPLPSGDPGGAGVPPCPAPGVWPRRSRATMGPGRARPPLSPFPLLPEGVQPQLQVHGAHRGERLQHLRVTALAAPGPPHVPLAQ